MAKSVFDGNAEEVSEWFYDQEEELEEEVEEMLDEVTKRTLIRALQEVPVDTGDLKESLDTDGHQVFSPLEYAPHVGLGTIFMSQQDYLWGPAKEELIKVLNEYAE